MNYKVLLEYIWIDGYNELRSKIKIFELDCDKTFTLNMVPEWNFDGSSTGQAEGKDSDVIIKPCVMYHNPFVNYIQGYLILCDCWNKDGTPHETNHRIKLLETYNKCKLDEPLFGIEQEYVMFERRITERTVNNVNTNVAKPYKWNEHDEP
jgi:glutamine synthetase